MMKRLPNVTAHAISSANYFQEHEAWLFMLRAREYAERIGCVTYAFGAMHDSIECTQEQSDMIAKWWAENTKLAGLLPVQR